MLAEGCIIEGLILLFMKTTFYSRVGIFCSPTLESPVKFGKKCEYNLHSSNEQHYMLTLSSEGKPYLHLNRV